MIGRKVWFPSDGPKGKIHLLFLKSHYRFILEPSGLGSHYGTLSGPIGHFSAESKPKPPRTAELKNMITNPPKKGTGYGYCGVTLGESLLHNHNLIHTKCYVIL